MAGPLPASIRTGSPIRCSEKPWDFWVTELGRSSPLRDEDFPNIKGANRRTTKRCGITRLKPNTMSLYGEFPSSDTMTVAVCHLCDMSIKLTTVHRHLTESHSIVDPILPPPAPAVKHKSSKSKHKHKETSLPVVDVEATPVLPPPLPVVHPPSAPPQESVPPPTDIPPTVVSVPRIVLTPQDVAYYQDIDVNAPQCTTQNEVKVSVEENDLPVVSIQDNTDLRLADDIIEIMNSEGIQSIEDIPEADTAAWKNLMQDFGAIQNMTLQNTSILSDGTIATHELYDANGTPVSVTGAYTITSDNSGVQYAQAVTLQQNIAVENHTVTNFPIKPMQCAPVKPPSKSKSKSSKSTKFQAREYDPDKHCGVISADSQKPCMRSLTCKAHTLSLRRLVENRSKTFDTLLADHRAAKQAGVTNQNTNSNNVTNQVSSGNNRVVMNQSNAVVNQGSANQMNIASQGNIMNQGTLNSQASIVNLNDISAVQQQQQPIVGLVNNATLVTQVNLSNQVMNQQTLPPNQTTVVGMSSPLIVSTPMDINAFNELESDRQVTEYYNSVMSSVSDVIGDGGELLVEGGAPTIAVSPPKLPEPRPGDIHWYPSAPRPLAACTFSTCHMGNALLLGKRLASVRSNFKSTLMRPHTKNISNSYYNFSQNSLSSRVNKNIHVNNSNKPALPEVRKLIMSCPELLMSVKTENAYFNNRQNGHLFPTKRQLLDEYDEIESKCMRQAEPSGSVRNKVSKHMNPSDLMEYMYDPLITEEKC